MYMSDIDRYGYMCVHVGLLTNSSDFAFVAAVPLSHTAVIPNQKFFWAGICKFAFSNNCYCHLQWPEN